MNTKSILVLVAILIIGGGVYFYSQNKHITPTTDGWSQYDNDIVFEFPSGWELTKEKNRIDGLLETLKIRGDGYVVELSRAGKGFPGDDATRLGEHVVAGQKVKILENSTNEGFYLTAGVFCGTWSVRIASPTKSRNIADRIIGSIQCSE